MVFNLQNFWLIMLLSLPNIHWCSVYCPLYAICIHVYGGSNQIVLIRSIVYYQNLPVISSPVWTIFGVQLPARKNVIFRLKLVLDLADFFTIKYRNVSITVSRLPREFYVCSLVHYIARNISLARLRSRAFGSCVPIQRRKELVSVFPVRLRLSS